MSEDLLPHRALPALDAANTSFWTSGADGVLRIERCRDCGTWSHPPTGRCPSCRGTHVEPTPVSGRGRVHSFTVNHQPWFPDNPPYTVVLIDLDEGASDAPVRITSNLVGTDPADIEIGMPVQVFFVQREDVWLPQFRAASGAQ